MNTIEEVKKILLHKKATMEFGGLTIPYDQKDHGVIGDLKIYIFININRNVYEMFLDLHTNDVGSMIRKYNSEDFELDKHLIYGFYDHQKEKYIYKRE